MRRPSNVTDSHSGEQSNPPQGLTPGAILEQSVEESDARGLSVLNDFQVDRMSLGCCQDNQLPCLQEVEAQETEEFF